MSEESNNIRFIAIKSNAAKLETKTAIENAKRIANEMNAANNTTSNKRKDDINL